MMTKTVQLMLAGILVLSAFAAARGQATEAPQTELDVLQAELKRQRQMLEELNRKRMEETEKKIALAEQLNRARKELDALQLELADTQLKIKEADWIQQDLARKLHQAVTQLGIEGHWQLRENHVSTAERLFKAALDLDPGKLNARMGMATCRYMQKDLIDAKRILDGIIEEDPLHAQALGLRGLIAFRENELHHATELLEKALLANPGEAQLHNYMGMVMLARHRRTEALRAFEKALELDPASAEIHMNIARLLATTRPTNLRKAKTHYETARNLGLPASRELEREIYKETTLPLTGAVRSVGRD